MGDAMYGVVYRMLLRMGVPTESVSALLDDAWVVLPRHVLRLCGGSRVKTFQTEMRHFRCTCKDPGLRYCLFKYVWSERQPLRFLRARFIGYGNWYGRQNLSRLREYFTTSEKAAGHK